MEAVKASERDSTGHATSLVPPQPVPAAGIDLAENVFRETLVCFDFSTVYTLAVI